MRGSLEATTALRESSCRAVCYFEVPKTWLPTAQLPETDLVPEIRKRARAVVQFYNRMNAGDDLLVKLLLDQHPDVDFRVPLRYPESSLALKPNAQVLPPTLLHRAWDRYEHRLRIPSWARANNLRIRRLSQQSDAVVHIGGSIFIEHAGSQDHWRRELAYYKTLRVPYFIIDANFGPFVSPAYPAVVEEILAGAADVCVRDRQTFKRFEHIPNIRLAPDAAFATLPPSHIPAREESAAVISAMDFSRRDPDLANKYESSLATVVRQLVRDGERIRLVSFCDYQGDLDAAMRIVERAKLTSVSSEMVEILPYTGDIDRVLSVVSSATRVVGSRFHAIVLGLAFGVPTFPVVYSDKSIQMLQDAGMAGPFASVDDPPSGEDWDRIPALQLAPDDRTKLRVAAMLQFEGTQSFFGDLVGAL